MSQPPPDSGPPAEASSLDVSFSGISEILGIAPGGGGPDPLVGRSIGDVTLVGVIAEGGMGRVYEGRQRSPDRPVAVKVLRPGFITPEGIRRFAREAELLGSLRHPHIAQIHWAGACDILGSAVPFIVMEFVRGGLPITAYAREQGLDTPQRLGLFRKVCDAVARAHAAGIVHRDLKPSNVLVDANGEPKLIDFGIARMAAGDGGGTAVTELGRLVGTVQYMSPEQISGDGAGIDPRTDVYALGLILHELVSGRRPYEIDPRRVFDAARVIRERKPVSLTVADGRQPAPALGRIVEQCLAIAPTRRYPDAAAVAAAVAEHHLQHPRQLNQSAAAVGAIAVVACATLALLQPWHGWPSPQRTVRAHPEAPVQPAKRLRPLTLQEALDSRSHDGALVFQDVSTISPEVATALVGRGLRLRLYDMPAVSPDVAAILGRNRNGLELHGVQTIDPGIAESLAKVGGPLCLDAVQSLDVETARILASHDDWLNLPRLQELPDPVLAELVRHRGHGMAIRVPGMLDRARAEIIARHRGMLYLLGIDTVEPAAARALAVHRGGVVVQAEHLTPEVDRLLAELD